MPTKRQTWHEVHHPVRVLLRRARRASWDECASEAFERGLIHDVALAELLQRNPYKENL